jgi:CubicO group peptidase (beta-lactamase class C family)
MRYLLPLLFIVGLGACTQRSASVGERAEAEGIGYAPPSSVFRDTARITEMTKAISAQTYPNIHSVLIAKDDKLVFEKYFAGEDQIWGDPLGRVDHTAEDLHDVRSISKSVVSACIGIAISQGKLKNVDQRVFDFFPEYSRYDSGIRSKLTVAHLLTMSSGMKWNEEVPYDNPENSEIRMIRSADPVEYVLSQPIENPPGEVWKYNGGTTQLLAAILKKVSGLPVDQFAKEFLFQPLGIREFEWVKYSGTDMPAAASGLRLRSRDLLKFGLLYANEGKWKDEQVIPQNWIRESFTSHVKRGAGTYGYQFWIWSDTLNGSPKTIIAAIGNGDQRIFIDTATSVVVVTTAGNYNKWNIEKNTYALLKDFIYPAMQ